MRVPRLVGRRLTTIVVVLIGLSSAASAQATPAQALFGRLMEARLDSLARDPLIAKRAPGLKGLALMQASGDSALFFVDDVGLRELSTLFGQSAAQATPEACARLYTGGGDAFPDAFAGVLALADSSLLDRWSRFMVRLVRAGILHTPAGRVASPEEIATTIRAIVAQQPAADRARLQRGAAKTGDVRDICLFTRTLYLQLGQLPPEKVGPVFRAMMLGIVPKLS